MKKQQIIKKDIRELIGKLTTVVNKNGFVSKNNSFQSFNGGYEFLWERDSKWKKDSIRVHYPEIINYLSVSHCIYYPVNQEYRLLSFCNIKWFLYKKSENYDIPSVLYNIRKNAFYNSIISDLEKSTKWFDDYSNSEKCLNKLKEEVANGDRDPNSNAYKWAVDYLKDIK